MRVAVQKWGNSLALRIPKNVAVDSRITRGTVVEVSLAKGRLVIRPVPARTYTLTQLLAGVTRKNLHREVESGGPVGRESW